MAESGFPELIKRLDAVIGLLVVTLPEPSEPRSLREQIKLLDAAGLGRLRSGESWTDPPSR